MIGNSVVSVLDEHACELGEGPSYDTRTDALFWFDIVNCTMFERRWADGETVLHTLPFMASAVASVDENQQLLAAAGGLFLRDRHSGALSLQVAIEADKPEIRSNDARVHPSGAFWVGTMACDEHQGAGAVWWYRAGELRQLFDRVTVPNSICFSADGASAFFACSAAQKLWRVACDPATGLPRGEPQVMVDGMDAEGVIDGSVMDAEGTLWNARWGGSRLDAYAPDGTLSRWIPIPALQPSCPAFVGPALDRLVVTSAWKGQDGATRAKDALGGQTFLLDIPVKGRAEPDVLL